MLNNQQAVDLGVDGVKSLNESLPVEVAKISNLTGRESKYRAKDIGAWVAVRPCDQECGGRTFLGVYLGDLQLDSFISYYPDKKELQVMPHTNPAIWVPDLRKIVWGCGSWWGVINSPEGLEQITDKDIENIWYVRAMKDLLNSVGAASVTNGNKV